MAGEEAFVVTTNKGEFVFNVYALSDTEFSILDNAIRDNTDACFTGTDPEYKESIKAAINGKCLK